MLLLPSPALLHLPPSQPGDGSCSPQIGLEQPGAPSSSQKALGSRGTAADKSLLCTRLIPTGESSSARQESSSQDSTHILPVTSLSADDILGKLLPPVTSWYRLSRDTSFSFS